VSTAQVRKDEQSSASGGPSRRSLLVARAVVIGAIAIVVIAIAWLAFLRGRPSYRVHVLFRDAGQLIQGNLVEVGGLPVGTVTNISLTRDGFADVEVGITDPAFNPLRQGTLASIGTVSLVSIANRYVALQPATGTAPIPSGGVIDETHTQDLVDIDQFLDYVTKPVRVDFQNLIKLSALAFSDPASQNATLKYANPAFGQLQAFLGQLTSDRYAFSTFISAGSKLVSTLAQHEQGISGGIQNISTVFAALASQSTALSDEIAKAPAALSASTNTFRLLNSTLVSINPALKNLQPVATPLANLFRSVVKVGPQLIPVVQQFDDTVPALTSALASFPGLRDAALPAFDIFAKTLNTVQPIVAGARPYAQDILQGLFRGLSGESAGSYDANGHYVVGQVGTLLGFDTGIDATVKALNGGTLPSYHGFRTGLIAPCPGGAGAKAQDGSSPNNAGGASICDPSYNTPSDQSP
jgi:phospholipid/cholesterol/gamma-HCH transport system substrate-binding protein